MVDQVVEVFDGKMSAILVQEKLCFDRGGVNIGGEVG